MLLPKIKNYKNRELGNLEEKERYIMNADFFDEVVSIIADVLEVDKNQIDGETAIGDLDSWDSLHHLQIISRLENKYGFRFTPDIIMDLEDVDDIVQATEDQLK